MSIASARRGFYESHFFSFDPLSQVEKKAFLDQLWPTPSVHQTTMDRTVDFECYFQFLEQERNPKSAQDHAIVTFADLFFIVHVLQNNHSWEFGQVVAAIQDRRPDLSVASPKFSNSIELAARLWLMMNIRNRMPSDLYQLQTSIPWHDSSSLRSVLATHITRHQCDQTVKFSEYLNFHDMKMIGGIKVEWTNNLTLHLTMKGPVVYVFHGVSILKRMRRSPSTTSVLNHEFIEETLATIDLLIPFTKASCNGWLAVEIKRLGLDQNIMHRDTPMMQKSRYPFWQDKLLVIEENFEKSKPRSFLQWWHDTRDMQQWWGFWLVVTGIFLTVLFGLIQSVTGIIQVARNSS
ncbi:hypothetical protein F5Y03DRAFT_296683 [Xylaria venustula]|nr:hypothetical protein F5Y03DRAFT_296683 [Xylaria venustula]